MKLRQLSEATTLKPGIHRVQSTWLYHGTSTDHLPSIKKMGLVPKYSEGIGPNPNQQQANAIYLTRDLDSAQEYAEWVSTKPFWGAKHTGGWPLILAVRFADLDETKFEIDESFLESEAMHTYFEKPWPKNEELDWKDSLYLGGTVAYTGIIPPELLTSPSTSTPPAN